MGSYKILKYYFEYFGFYNYIELNSFQLSQQIHLLPLSAMLHALGGYFLYINRFICPLVSTRFVQQGGLWMGDQRKRRVWGWLIVELPFVGTPSHRSTQFFSDGPCTQPVFFHTLTATAFSLPKRYPYSLHTLLKTVLLLKSPQITRQLGLSLKSWLKHMIRNHCLGLVGTWLSFKITIW